MAVGGWSRDRARRLVAPAAVVMTVLATTTGWWAWSARAEVAARSVLVTATGSQDCAPGRDVNNGRRVLMVAASGRECRIDLVLTNGSDRTVRVDAVQLSNVGTAEETINQIAYAVESGQGELGLYGPDEMPSGIPARYVLDEDLPPGEVLETSVALVLNEENCRGGTNELSPWPSVAINVGGRQLETTPATSLVTVLAPELRPDGPGCDD